MKSILIISSAFYPRLSPRSFRTTELAKELARQGHEVTLLLPENIRTEEGVGYATANDIRLEFYGPLKWRLPGKTRLFGDWSRKFGRLLTLLFEYPNIEIYFKLSRHLRKILQKYDALISIAMPHEIHWAVAKVHSKRPLATTWIADCGDPFMGLKTETIAPPFYFGFFENHFLKVADYITVPAKGSIEAYNQSYRNKIRVVPQGFNFDDVRPTVVQIDHSFPTFAYAGGVAASGVRSLTKVVALLKRIKRPFEFHIYSPNAKDISETIIKGCEDKIILHNALSRQDLLSEIGKMDFLINLDNGTSISTPSKLIDYALTGRPILNLDPMSPDEEKMHEFLSGDYRNQLIIDDIERFNIRKVARQFVDLMK